METEQIKKFINSVVPDVENDFVIGFAFMGGLLEGEQKYYYLRYLCKSMPPQKMNEPEKQVVIMRIIYGASNYINIL